MTNKNITLALYHYDGCVFCSKVKNYINKLNFNIDLVNIYKDGNRDDLIKYGGSPQVPCLRIENSKKIRWLYESDDIIDYLSNI